MNSHITLHLQDPQFQVLSLSQLCQFSAFLLNYNNARFIAFKQGLLLYQAFSNYLVFIELFDYHIKKNIILDVEVKTSAFFMSVMLNGHATTANIHNEVISETHGNCSTISHINAGMYKRTLFAGKHSLLVLTFRQDWFVKKMANNEIFAPLIASYLNDNTHYVLPCCAIAKSIYNAVAHLDLNSAHTISREGDILNFVEDSISRYSDKFIHKQYDANTYKREKIQEFSAFIKENCTEEIVEDMVALASKFSVSERALGRLAQDAFHISLRKQVIIFRILKGLRILVFSSKTVREIALEVGFSTPRYFSRTFKKYFGVNPEDIRINPDLLTAVRADEHNTTN